MLLILRREGRAAAASAPGHGPVEPPPPPAPTALPPTPFQRFVAPARERCGLWRLVLGLLVIALITFTWAIVLAAIFVFWIVVTEGVHWSDGTNHFVAGISAGTIHGQAYLLGSLFGGTLGVAAAVRWLHRRGLGSVIGPARGAALSDFGKGFLLTMAAAGAIVGVGALLGEFPARSTLPLDLWLAWLAPMIVLVLLQVASEEIVFRGYMLQQLAARFRTPLIWVGVPAAVFTVLHAGAAATPELSLAILAIVFTYALTAAALVWLTGSLWAAIGAHAGHNLPLLLFFGAAGDPLGGALWEYPRPDSLADVYLTGAVELAVLVYVLSPLSPFRKRHCGADGLAPRTAG